MKLKQLHELYQRQTGLPRMNTQNFLEFELLRSAPAIIELYEAAKIFRNAVPLCDDIDVLAADIRLMKALKSLEQ